MFTYIAGFLVSLGLMIFLMPYFIDYLKKNSYEQTVSEYALEEYKQKAKTPIMGGLLFVLVPSFVYLVYAVLTGFKFRMMFIVLSYLLFCLVGFIDDYLILIKKDNAGLSPAKKLIMEFIFVFVFYFLFKGEMNNTVRLFGFDLNLGIIYLPFMILLFASEANAVNFTDGMDGLCAGVSCFSCVGFAVLAAMKGENDIVLFLCLVLGGLLGYLKFNFHPAKIFMGDSGSLALGALFSSVSVMLHAELALVFMGGVFVVEMGCVLIQQISVRLFHKRVFSYTPIHYAFILKGHKEVTVVTRFYLCAFVCMILGILVGVACV